MRAVNLLPSETRDSRKRLPKSKVLLAGTAPLVAAALVYVGYSVEHAKVADARATLQLAHSELSGLGPAASVATAGRELAVVRANRLRALQDAVGRRVPWDVTLDQIARVLPADAWLTQLDAQSPTPTTTGSSAATASASSLGAALTIGGYTYSNESVAHVLARLALVPSLGNVSLGSTTSSTVGSTTLVQFQINATVVEGGGS